MTAIADQMKAQGIKPRDVRLHIALAEFMNNGGTEERALALVRDVYHRARRFQAMNADKASDVLPAPRAPNDSDTGHRRLADKAETAAPASLSPRDDAEGHADSADKAIPTAPSLSSPYGREGHTNFADKASLPAPSASSRAAVLRAATNIARSVLDSFKVRDGRAIGDLAFCELESLRFENSREASVIRQIQRHYANAPGNALVRELIGAGDLHRFIQKAAEAADAE